MESGAQPSKLNNSNCQQRQQRPFNGLWSGTTRVGRYQKELSPTHTYPNQRASFIIFLYLQRSMASSLFSLRAWQSSRTTSFQVFFGLPLGLEPSTSCSIHFFTQSSSSFRNTWPYQRSLFCCNTNAMSSTPSVSVSFSTAKTNCMSHLKHKNTIIQRNTLTDWLNEMTEVLKPHLI